MRQNGLEERPQVGQRRVGIVRATAFLGHGVQDGKVELVFGGVEIDEQIVDLVEHLAGAGVLSVDLVDHHDGRQLQGQRLGEHEARLGQGAFGRIHQQHDAVHHAQRALHFAAEVGVAGRVHNVDLDISVPDGRVFGHDRDALLALQIERVEHALLDFLIGPEDAALPEHGVDQRRFAVVDVRHNGDIAQGIAHCTFCV